ncbi:universal stress protein [Methylobacterium nodulans]|uniref:UspA domain protein n=1 Tax=Methylobacterium nodulans (strain LMG 21967 / CNCM I-2342 / ORS 2060) TaxID=460265 RepID=B8IVA4_METNO|nr:universal stress protein [Methylobacterium nodulans]ACL60955.1 UspA domain protein [Methylobacterium nodulans ORS 2060]
MSYASIMVAVDLAPQARNRVRLAGHLADQFGARLIGVAAEQPAYAVPPLGATAASAYALAASSEIILNDLSMVHAAFEEGAGTRSRVEWRSNLDFPLSFLIAQAATADLVVAGREEGTGPPLFAFDPGDAVMRLGRPLLVVPPEIDHLVAKRVVIGWKNTREARRAVSDALPFLRRASHVAVVSVDEGQGAADGGDVVSLLKAHGVAATNVRVDAAGDATSRALVDAASELGADLIVTGAYGHGRLSEWIFGGVTRDLLAASPVCCLMSH